MNLMRLSWRNLQANPLTTALNIFLLALGIATITLLLLFSDQLQDRLVRNAKGIDLVVGAKGSPLQVILSTVYHADVPTGNVPLDAATVWRQHPLVKASAPVSLGDSFHGFRIVGTEPGLLGFYGAQLATGQLWQADHQAVLGAEVARQTGLRAGQTFAGAHGLAEGGHDHAEEPYTVTGVLAPTGTVLDKLVLTSLESVWEVHEHEETTAMGKATGIGGAADPEHREITALLLQFKTPMAMFVLPRQINQQSALQAASPVLESTRLLEVVGFGLDAFRAFAGLLVLSAGLGMFVALYNTLRDRQYDLAVMRLLGASPLRVFATVWLEGLLLSLLAALLGIALGHGLTELLGWWIGSARSLTLTGQWWVPEEGWLLLLALAIGALSALLPAIRAARTPVALLLSEQ